MSFNLRVALRYLFSPNKSSFSSTASWLAIGGLSIGITALMLTASIIQGFQKVISEKLSSFEGQGRIQHIVSNQIDLTNPTLDSLVQSYSKAFSPFVRGVCMVRSGIHADGVLIEGIKLLPKAISDYPNNKIKPGEIVMGNGLTQQLKIEKGDTVFLQVFSSGEFSPFLRKIKPVMVKEIFHSGLQEYDKTLAYIHFDDARNLFGFENNFVSGMILSGINIPEIRKEISYPYFYESWRDRHTLLFEWIDIQRWPAFIMFGLIALVGIVNIIAAIAMIITQKSGQIGILMAQGTQRSTLKSIFMIQGGFIGLIGGIIGGLLSMSIIWVQLKFEILKIPAEIYFMDQIPFSFDYLAFGLILVFTFIFCMVASWWPTKVVTTLNPAVALEYE